MHLYGDILEKYVAGELPGSTVDAIDTHVTNCLFCAHTLANETARSTRWERRGWLGRLTQVPQQHVVADGDHYDLRALAA